MSLWGQRTAQCSIKNGFISLARCSKNVYHSKCFTLDYVTRTTMEIQWTHFFPNLDKCKLFLNGVCTTVFKIRYRSCWMVFHLWWFVTSQPYSCDMKVTINLPESTLSVIQKVYYQTEGGKIVSPHTSLQMCRWVDVFRLHL